MQHNHVEGASLKLLHDRGLHWLWLAAISAKSPGIVWDVSGYVQTQATVLFIPASTGLRTNHTLW